MAAIGLSNCTVYRKFGGEWTEFLIVTPATADSNDTLDISSLANGLTLVGVSAWDTTGEDSVTCTSSSGNLTIDAAGGTTNHAYVISAKYGKV